MVAISGINRLFLLYTDYFYCIQIIFIVYRLFLLYTDYKKIY
ncbi:hypothetical protein BMW23_1226 [Bodo saltans virus]|uniref:Transmembrane protein n=1 Tax=Bodo saltans virus TaxID=2024608 RepID=A0A2H4UWB8_9VIRU|nr:hypothetical protein QJ851_gp1170 [Bodo saltans virus]YP_010779045.1 hypothetical protein QJ851_gp1206 [Bodo saltans virus]ATZ81233.1 hypothetical protein BMW23_1190 [Bodo saltans virus]ATZ81269.1 hypothetical protein BMW23_1226 [Bodo saltans virus]